MIAFVVLIMKPGQSVIGQRRIGHSSTGQSKPKSIHSNATGARNASDMQEVRTAWWLANVRAGVVCVGPEWAKFPIQEPQSFSGGCVAVFLKRPFQTLAKPILAKNWCFHSFSLLFQKIDNKMKQATISLFCLSLGLLVEFWSCVR